MTMLAVSFRLCLYVARGAPNSVAAQSNLQHVLRRLGEDNVDLEVVDVVTDPQRALADRILVSPTLVRLSPDPCVVLIGNLSDLDLVEKLLKRPF
jgi:circadian clock protein KaiB